MANAGIDNVEEYVGRKTPDQYDPDLSYFVLDAGSETAGARRRRPLLSLVVGRHPAQLCARVNPKQTPS